MKIASVKRYIHALIAPNSWAELCFIPTLLLGAAGVCYSMYRYKLHSSKTVYINKMSKALRATTQEVRNYIEQQRERTQGIATSEQIIKAVQRLTLLTTPALVTGKDPALVTDIKDIGLVLQQYATSNSYHNTLLIDRNGRVLFSEFAPEYVGKQLIEQKSPLSPLGKTFLRTLMTARPAIANFDYDPILKRPALFVVVPIIVGKEFIGAVAQEALLPKLYSILQEHIPLGKTGEAIFGIALPEGVVFINSSRLQATLPFKYFVSYQQLLEYKETPLIESVSGNEGTGLENDYRGQETVAAWNSVPILGWGATNKIDRQELEASYSYLWSLMLWFLAATTGVLISYFFTSQFAREKLGLQSPLSPRTIRHILSAGAVFCTLLLALASYQFWYQQHKRFSYLQTIIEQRTENCIQNIEQTVKGIEHVGVSLQQDLTSGYLTKSNLIERMKRDMADHPIIASISVAYQPQTANDPLFAPMVSRSGTQGELELLQQETVYNYTAQQTTALGGNNWNWYHSALTAPKVWFDFYFNPTLNAFVSGYSLPFYIHNTKNVAGVIHVQYSLSPTQTLVQNLSVGTIGYGALITREGYFIYHPTEEYTKSRKTLLQLAQESDSKSYSNVAQEILAGKYGWHSFTAQNGEKQWIYSAPIPLNGRVLLAYCNPEDAALPMELVREYCMFIFLSAIGIIFFFLLAFLGPAFWKPMLLARILSGLCACLLLGLLVIVRLTPTVRSEDSIVVSDQTSVNKLIQEKKVRAQRIHESPPLEVSVGLFLNSVHIPNSTSVTIAGVLWQKYPPNTPSERIAPAQFTQALEPQTTITKETYRSTDATGTLVGWNFSAKLWQRFDFSRHPFDAVVITVRMQSPDQSQDIFLVPAFTDYTKGEEPTIQGIDSSFSLSGYNFKKSFFAIDIEHQEATYGFKSYAALPQREFLVYTLVLSKTLLYDFAVFLLPVLIIFFSLFTVLSMVERDGKSSLKAFSSYTALIFAVTMLHKNLRDQYNTSEILYFEYLFFMLYTIFIILVLYSIISLHQQTLYRRAQTWLHWYKIFFWPIQLAILVMVTLGVFYS